MGLLKKNKKRNEQLGCVYCLHGDELGSCTVREYEENCPYAETLGEYKNYKEYCDKHSIKEIEKIGRDLAKASEPVRVVQSKKTKKEQALYDLCESCQYDYGEFQSFRQGKNVRGVTYRGCERYILTGEHLNGAPYYDKTGAHCPYWIEKTEESKKAAQKERIFKIYRW